MPPAPIERRLVLAPPPAEVYRLLTQAQDRWWCQTVTPAAKVGEIATMRFTDGATLRLEALVMDPSERVAWRVVEGSVTGWKGSTIAFLLRPHMTQTSLTLVHERLGTGPTSPDRLRAEQSWALRLESLAALVRYGAGQPG
jgi:hypothetical protein